MNDKDGEIYLISFVDDLLLCGNVKQKMKIIKDKLSMRFAMKDLGTKFTV